MTVLHQGFSRLVLLLGNRNLSVEEQCFEVTIVCAYTDPDFEPEDTMKQFKAAVTKEAFLKETEGVLSDAIRTQRELEGAYASKYVGLQQTGIACIH